MSKKGMWKKIDPRLMEFIRKHSPRLCPNGKYDNRIICTQMDLIRFFDPILKNNAT